MAMLGMPCPCRGFHSRARNPIAVPGMPRPGMLYLCWARRGCARDVMTMLGMPWLGCRVVPAQWGARLPLGRSRRCRVGSRGWAVGPRTPSRGGGGTWHPAPPPAVSLPVCRQAEHRRDGLSGAAALGGGDAGGAGLCRQREPPTPRRLRQAGGRPGPPPGEPQRHPCPRRHLPVPGHQHPRLCPPQRHRRRRV